MVLLTREKSPAKPGAERKPSSTKLTLNQTQQHSPRQLINHDGHNGNPYVVSRVQRLLLRGLRALALGFDAPL